MTPRALTLLSGAALVSACGGGLVPSPAPAPRQEPPPPPPVARAAVRTALPARIGSVTWRVTSTARIRVSGERDEQRIDSRALVSWTQDRQPSGALRATGQVDSFTVRASFDNGKSTPLPSMPALLLLDAVVDSTNARVVTRPPLANECDRPEAGAAALARELLVRLPDGAAEGDQWSDSTVSLVCRSGVPMTVRTVVRSTLERLQGNRFVVTREISSTLEGRGGSVFRALDVSGTATGTQRLELDATRGSVETLEGSSTLTLQVSERAAPNPPRMQQVVQRVDVKAERAR